MSDQLSCMKSLPPGTSLVQTLCDLGPEITSEPATVRALLQRFGITEVSPPTDPQVVEIISTLSRFAAEGTQLCDAGALIRAISFFVSLLVISTIILLTSL
jgi:CCR4-NOT transcription complex subunit 1